jgi:P-type Ca2+ transporter type 2C
MVNGLDVDDIVGLDENDALLRLGRDGYNELPSEKKRGPLHMLLDVVKEPMFILLVACGTLYFFLGDTEEALMLLGFVFVVIGITLYQGTRPSAHLMP